MRRRRAAVLGSIVWGVTTMVIAVGAVPDVNQDARLLVGVASVAFPSCAVGAAVAPRLRADRLAGLLLMLSVATPTYFAYVANLSALMVGLALVVAPSITLGDCAENSASVL